MITKESITPRPLLLCEDVLTSPKNVPLYLLPGCLADARTDHNELLITGAKVDRKNIGGVGFLVNSTVHHLVDSYKIINPRVAVLRLETKDQGTISTINGYAPTSAATNEEKEEFYKLFERTVNDENYKVVVGDFNATVEAFEPAMHLGKPKWRNAFGDRPCSYKQTLESVRRLRAAFIWHRLGSPSCPCEADSQKEDVQSNTHKPAPLRIPRFKSEELEYVMKSYDWNFLEDPSEDYDLLSKELLKCASISCEATSPFASRLNAHAIKLLEQRRAVKLDPNASHLEKAHHEIKLLEQRRAVKLDPNASHLEKVTISKACRIAVKESKNLQKEPTEG
ncbi:unnamed protein product [Heligmosomoides polygyrus]|uniref:Endo/exonuclease/phosphatase domain-containing protein n=1 Tax=Heligmosomoides polygyrus TaxID=6339 RepID=A0A183GG40_HELPZ|nr:unnamed protein product [Heligmosomoides polygyrus]